MAILRIRARVEDETREGLTEVEASAEQSANRIGDVFAGVIAAQIASAAAQALQDAADQFDEFDRRVRNVQTQTGLLTAGEEALRGDLTRAGFQENEISQAILTSRQFDIELGTESGPAGPTATGAELPLVAAQLARGGFDTRFLPQLATAFGIDDPEELARQLAGGFSLSVQAGQNFEEIFSEIADNPQVYQAAGSIPQAAAFLAQQNIVPSETTIQLEQGNLQFPGTPVSANLADIYAGLPGFADRLEGAGLETDFIGQLGLSVLDTIPLGTQLPRAGFDGSGPANAAQGFNQPAGQVLVDGLPVGTDAFAARADDYRAAAPEAAAPGAEGSPSWIALQIRLLEQRIDAREAASQNPSLLYDPEKAAAANEADQRQIGLLTGELNELVGN